MTPSCPVCGKKHTSIRYGIKNYKYYSCDNCQMLFISPLPSRSYINNYYSKYFDYKNGLINQSIIRQQSKHILKNLRKFNPHGKKLLDIGSGYGFFTDEARKSGISALGIEPSIDLYKYSVNKFKIPCINTSLDKYIKNISSIGKFDFITLIHVIEHFDNPKILIDKATKLLNKNGILYIETPNYDSWLSKTEKSNYIFLTPPEHIYIFSMKSFRVILKPNPTLKIVYSLTYSYPAHIIGIIKILFNKLNKLNRSKKNKNDDGKPELEPSGIKYPLIDKFLAKLFYTFLNLFNKGSILELYIMKQV